MISTKSKNQIATALAYLGLAATVNTVSAQPNTNLVTDIQLRASSSATPPNGPDGYTRLGYWDVAGKSQGTDGSTGHWMMALYANKVAMDSTTTEMALASCVTDVQLRISSLRALSDIENYTQIGYWQINKGGTEATKNRSRGIMALYVHTGPIGSTTETELTSCVTDVQLRASNSSTPPSGPEGYTRIGYWKVSDGGSKGTDESTGRGMMALYTNQVPLELTEETVDSLPDFDDFHLPFHLESHGSAKVLEGESGHMTLRLVPAETKQTGNAFSQTQVNVASGFSTVFSFQITEPSNDAAGDGLVFVIQNNQSNAQGEGESGMGYATMPKSVGVEFDIWNNDLWRNDPDNNHVGINLNGGFEGATASVVPSFQDGAIWYAWIDYNGSQLEVRTNQTGERPSEPLLSQAVNLAEILGSTDGFVGFTASTGGAFANHDILSWTFQEK